MNIIYRFFINLVFVIGIFTLSLSSANAQECELGDIEILSTAKIQRLVYTGSGEHVGLVFEIHPGKWEALVLGQGVMNELFVNAEQAAQAICDVVQKSSD